MSFVHLHCHSPYSFLDGAAGVDRLIEHAALLGMPAIALTDHNNVSGAVRWQRKATAAGLKPLQGVELTLEGGQHLTLLATGPEGYGNLCRLVTAAHLGYVPGAGGGIGPGAREMAARRGQPRAKWADLTRYAKGCIALSGCRRGEIPALILQGRRQEAEAAARRYQSAFGPEGFYLELQGGWLPGDRPLNRALRDLGSHLSIPLVATADVHYRTREEFFVHDLLTCMRTLTRLDAAHPERPLNAEQYLQSPVEMARRFRSYPEALTNTLAIAERCQPVLSLGQRRDPAFPVPEGTTATGMLRELTYQGARERYGQVTPAIKARLEHELAIILRLGYEDYFLLVWDVCRYARSEGIRCAGRGSAADSAVAYCLFITNVDAFSRGLLFERFMSLERAETPDIDVDFDARHRDRVADYVFRKYGDERVAAVCTYNTFHARSAVRDLGKAMGFPPETLDLLAKRLPWGARADQIVPLLERLPELRRSGLPREKLTALLRACAQVAGFPRHLGTHLGGLVISREPLMAITPLQWAAKGCTVCQFDKEYVEDLGLVKLDLLSLRTLSAVDDALQDLRRERIEVGYDDLQPDDAATYEMLNTGETIGVFQLESPAQRALQGRLGANCFEDIVASVAIIRPGPIKGNMVEPYIARRHGLEPVTYLHPKLQPIVEKTYGVVLFQEQVIEIATVIAGFSPGEADGLRRVMTHARNPADMAEIGRRFVEKARAQGIEAEVADTIFSYIQGYASYGFCEAHAAAFGDTAYRTAYMVRHQPAAFFAALLSNQPMGYYPPNTLVWEARRRGAAVLPLDLHRSHWPWAVEQTAGGLAMRVGMMQVAGLSRGAAAAIAAEQAAAGPFRSLRDFCRRLGGAVDRGEVEALILAGAFEHLHPNRRALLWELAWLREAGTSPMRNTGGVGAGAAGASLLATQTTLPGLAAPDGAGPPTIPDFDDMDRMRQEYQVLGIMAGKHYMEFWRADLQQRGFQTAAAVKRAAAGVPVRSAGLVVRPHRPPTRSGRTVVFLSLEDETGMIDATIFEDVYMRYGHLIFRDPRPPLMVSGRVDRRGQSVSIRVSRIAELIRP